MFALMKKAWQKLKSIRHVVVRLLAQVTVSVAIGVASGIGYSGMTNILVAAFGPVGYYIAIGMFILLELALYFFMKDEAPSSFNKFSLVAMITAVIAIPVLASWFVTPAAFCTAIGLWIAVVVNLYYVDRWLSDNSCLPDWVKPIWKAVDIII